MRILIFLSLFYSIHAILYDRYTGEVITEEQTQRYAKDNTTATCTIEIEPCDPNEGRRVDGSCNNRERPTSGAERMPYDRMLHATSSAGIGKSASGDDLPLPRVVRTHLLVPGSELSEVTTQMWTSFLLFLASDTTSQHDSTYFMFEKTHCCQEEGKTDPECIPNMIPEDDFLRRLSGIQCMNLTKPHSFQSLGCAAKNTTFSRIVYNTPAFDLANIYGNSETKLNKSRMFEGGYLKYEIENGKIWPPSYVTESSNCRLNQKPAETRCHETPNAATNSLGPINLFSVIFWRYHNFIAEGLRKVNPCWSDQKLFDTARDINIAVELQICYYELWKLTFGEEILIKEGIISTSPGFRDVYDSSLDMQMFLEFPYALRYFHTVQNANQKMYDTNGSYIEQMPIVDMTFRTGYFAVDNNMEHMTQGLFRQPSGAVDNSVDILMTNLGLGRNQLAVDILTSDLSKGREFLLPSYCEYRKLICNETIKCWEDLHHAFDPESLEILASLYGDVQNMELLAGIWLEKPANGSMISSVMGGIIIKQFERFIKADMHWYERPNRPNAYTLPQILEIRKATVASLFCDVGDSVTEIQRHAFRTISPENPLVSCSEIPTIDFSAWSDPKCQENETACSN